MKITTIFEQDWVKKKLFYVIAGVVYISLIAFTEKKINEKSYSQVNVQIASDSKYQNHFLDNNDILQFLKIRNNAFNESEAAINLRKLEKTIRRSPYIENAQVWLDLGGQLRIDVRLERPMIRLVRSNKSDIYITENAKCMPVSPKYTSRVVVIEGGYVEKMIKYDTLVQEEIKPYIEFVKLVQEDKFWNTLIAQMRVDKNGELILYPQIGKQIIEFGKPEEAAYKLKKLAIFYNKILQMKGWNYYSSVNIKHTNQIICKK
jgi:cell division protein FtsQ